MRLRAPHLLPEQNLRPLKRGGEFGRGAAPQRRSHPTSVLDDISNERTLLLCVALMGMKIQVTKTARLACSLGGLRARSMVVSWTSNSEK